MSYLLQQQTDSVMHDVVTSISACRIARKPAGSILLPRDFAWPAQ
jgi:hypothetical protein